MKKILIISLFTFVTNTCFSQTFNRQRLDSLFKVLEKKEKFNEITIENEKLDNIDSNNYKWFKLRLNINEDSKFSLGKTFLIQWCNINLDDLLNSDWFKFLINNENLIYCSCYNFTDVSEQTKTNFNKFSDEPLPKGVVLKLNEYGDKEIDTSKNWGRSERVVNVNFMAAPRMWFGPGFNPIYELNRLLEFKYSTKFNEIVYIELFDLYAEPHKFRSIQKEYWDFLKKSKMLKKYEENNSFDFTEWLMKQAKR